jgi:8-oxo-dGTP diphosphatase
VVHVTCAIIIDGSKVLVTQRNEAMKLPLKWEFPGGKINLNESAETCIKRELIEELNIEIEILEKLTDSQFEYPTFTINLIPFVARVKAGQLILREHKAYEWLHPNELKALDWAPADIPVLEQFMKSKYAVGRTL